MKWVERGNKKSNVKNNSILEEIGNIRGIKDVNRFLNPTENEMFDPYLIKNIEEASERIVNAIYNNEKITISVDCDADGVTSSVAMMRFLGNYVDNIDYVYGQRGNGHGIYEQTRLNFVTSEDVDDNGEITDEAKRVRYELNSSNLDKISESDLLIIIDSSSNDTEMCNKLIEDYGVDIIIIDHHNIEKDNPNVLLVNPQQEGCNYPNKHLSGAGVVLKVMEVITDMLGDDSKVDPYEYIDLIAVGMYADVMPIDVLENRYIIMHGLRNMRNVGLIRILRGAKADLYKLNGDSIGFSIAPMINGVARLDQIELAIDILMTDDDDVAKKIRLKMHKLNEERKSRQKEIVNKYKENIDINEKIIIVMDEDSSRGFNGLVAQQLSDLYKRPAFVGRIHNGYLSGSFRSYGGFNLKEFLSESNLVKESMGHNYAGGATIEEENIEKLKNYIEETMPKLSEKKPTIVYDLEINVDDIEDYIKPMEQFNMLTGNGFPKVIVRVNNITVEEADIIGKTMETCKIKTFDNLELIKFRVDENYGKNLGYFDTIDAVGQLHMNEWFNFKTREKISTPQIILSDFRHNE